MELALENNASEVQLSECDVSEDSNFLVFVIVIIRSEEDFRLSDSISSGHKSPNVKKYSTFILLIGQRGPEITGSCTL